MNPFHPLNGQAHVAPQEALPFFVSPTAYVGLGGYAKGVFPYLDAFIQQQYGRARLSCLPMVLFDFDPAPAEVSKDGTIYSIEPYFNRTYAP